MKRTCLFLIVTLSFFTNCGILSPEETKENDSNLIGTWYSPEWSTGEYSYVFEADTYLLTMRSSAGIDMRIENGTWTTKSGQIYFGGTVTKCNPCSKNPPYTTTPVIPYRFKGDTLLMQWGASTDGSWDSFLK